MPNTRDHVPRRGGSAYVFPSTDVSVENNLSLEVGVDVHLPPPAPAQTNSGPGRPTGAITQEILDSLRVVQREPLPPREWAPPVVVALQVEALAETEQVDPGLHAGSFAVILAFLAAGFMLLLRRG